MWLLLPILVYSFVFLYVRHIYTYWKRKGFPSELAGLKPFFLLRAYRREFRHVEAISEAYRQGIDRLYGIYCFFRPVLLVRNVELACNMLQQAGTHFTESKWDYVRGYRRYNLLEKIAPIFSAKRLTHMLDEVQLVSEQMLEHLQDQEIEGQVQLDVQKLLRVYAANIVGNLVYGFDVNNFEETDHILNSYVNQPTQHACLQSFTLRSIRRKSPLTYRLLDIIEESVEQREEQGIIRKDILQLLVKFRNGNDLDGDEWQLEKAEEEDKVISVLRLAKVAEDLLQSALDSIASTITLTLYEIAQQPQIVEKLQTEIKELNCENGQLQWEHLGDLKYLDMCITETLRKYPPVPMIERTFRKSYTVPNTKLTIGEGKTLIVPVLAIQRDEKYFGEPLKYKPLRFLHDKPEESEQCKSAFVGFGIGGPQCTAQNFAKMVIKVGLIKLLQHYDLELPAATAAAVQVSHLPAPLITSPGGLQLRLKTRAILAQQQKL